MHRVQAPPLVGSTSGLQYWFGPQMSHSPPFLPQASLLVPATRVAALPEPAMQPVACTAHT